MLSLSKIKTLENVIRYGLYLLAVVSPVVFSSQLLWPFESTRGYVLVALVEVLLLLTLCWHWLRKSSIAMDVLSFAFVLFVLIVLFASLIGIDPVFSFWGTLYRQTGGLIWLHILILYGVLRCVLIDERHWQAFLMATVIGALLTVVGHLVWLTDASVYLSTAQGGSTLGNSSFYGSYLIFIIGLSGYLWTTLSKGVLRQVSAVATGIFILTLLSLSAHAAIISFLGGGVLFLGLWLWRSPRRNRQWLGRGLVAVLLFGFLSVSFLALRPGSFIQESFTDMATSSRLVLWDMGLQAIWERPVFGWGLETFEYVSLDVYNTCFGSQKCGWEVVFDRIHNKFLDVAFESGLVGLGSYLLLLVLCFKILLQGVFAKESSPFQKHPMAAVVLVSTLSAYLVQSLTNFDSTMTMVLLAVFLALVSWHAPIFWKRNLHPFVWKGLMGITIVLLPVALTFFVARPIVANAALLDFMFTGRSDIRAEKLPQALYGSAQGDGARRVMAAEETTKILWNHTAESFQDVQTIFAFEVEMERQALEQYLLVHPKYMRASLALGALEQVNGRLLDASGYERATAVLERLVLSYPSHPKPAWALASVYLELGRAEEAVALLDHIRTISPEFEKAHHLYLIGLLFTEDQERYEVAAQEVVEMFPGLFEQAEALREANLSELSRWFLTFFHQ